jgi:integral membrane protein (TIGR00529 family)
MLLWVGFGLAVVCLVVIARRNLALGMAVAAVVLAAFTLDLPGIGAALQITFSDPAVWLLALVVGLIPLIGGVMEINGQMASLVDNLRIGIRPFLALSPALLGMLPMPGGALLSAPIIERGAGHTAGEIKAAANVWFRHTLLLIYPLGSALIASTKIAGLTVYAVIPYLVPAFLLMTALGYLCLLRRADGTLAQRGRFSLPGLIIPLGIILAAPLIDLLLKTLLPLPVTEIGTAAGVSASLLLALGVGRPPLRALGAVVRKMRPWKYALIILAMFAFLNVFTRSGVPERIASLALPPVVLTVGIGFALGLITGRVQAPMSILLPIYVTAYGAMAPMVFAVMFFAVYLGYILTPIHPCISVSLEYFDTSFSAFLRRLAIPVIVGFVAALGVGALIL